MKFTITDLHLTRRATAFQRIRIPAPAAQFRSGRDCDCTSAANLAGRSTAYAELPESGGADWSGTIVLENVMTGDGRMIAKNALRWATLPMPLRAVRQDVGAHDNAVVVGRIRELSRSGNKITASGDFDLQSPDGLEAARQVHEGLMQGVSVDLDEVSFEIRVAKDLLDTDDGLLAEPADGSGPATEPEVDEDGRVTVLNINADDEVMVTTDARIRAATIVAIPAFEEARITLADAPPETGDDTSAAPADDEKGETPDGDPCSCDEDDPDYDPDCSCPDMEDNGPDEDTAPPASAASAALIAAAAPVEPPADWFNDPQLDGPTPLTVTDDGRVFGHLAAWGTCHAAYQGQCVTPPRSESGYAYFRTGTVLTAEGSEIPVGHLTLDTLHAGKNLSATDTLAHYEHTGRSVADVAAGEDSHGIWVAGALRPTVTSEQVRALRASPLSGDWRRVGGNLELVAALAVNVPGFPIPRPQGLVASGVTTALIASGMVPPRRVVRPGTSGALSPDDLYYLKRLAARERREAQADDAGLLTKAQHLARRVRAVELERRVKGL